MPAMQAMNYLSCQKWHIKGYGSWTSGQSLPEVNFLEFPLPSGAAPMTTGVPSGLIPAKDSRFSRCPMLVIC